VDEPGVRFGIANALIVMVLIAAATTHLTGPETEALTIAAAGLACSGLSVLVTASVGVVAWALFTGFVVNRLGALTVGHHDLLRLATFAVVTGVVAHVGHHLHLAEREHAHE
jgi:hypothetical protein